MNHLTTRKIGYGRRVAKVVGADFELGNSVLGLDHHGATGYEASRAVLHEIEGVSSSAFHQLSLWGANRCNATYFRGNGRGGFYSQDSDRKYLPANGGCAYIDLNHLELCIPEVRSAHEHVAATHAMLRIALRALERANTRLPTGQKIRVLINNSDGQSNSYGSHLNVLLSRLAWDDVFNRRLHHLLFLASYQVSSIVFTGQGKVGSENGRPSVPFQLSQRADFFETLSGIQTTHRRPIVNSRDESLCGRAGYHATEPVDGPLRSDGLARLHCIFYDNTLCDVSSLLKVGVMQIILAMIEAEVVPLGLVLDDPLAAVLTWSHDPTLRTRNPLVSGKSVTIVEHQLMFLEAARKLQATGELDLVPRAGEILALWEDTLCKLESGDLAALMGRLDWVLKLHTLERAQQRHGDLGWDAPQLKVLDQLYGSLEPDEGLFWAYANEGAIETVISEREIEHFEHEPPDDTRAWARAMLLRTFTPDEVESIDWHTITLRIHRADGGLSRVSLELDDPLRFTREHMPDLVPGWAPQQSSLAPVHTPEFREKE